MNPDPEPMDSSPDTGPRSQQMPPRRPHMPWGPLLGAAGALLAASYGGWRLLGELRHLRTRQVSLEQQGVIAQQQLNDLEQRHAQLSTEHQQLVIDRNNLIEQAKRAVQERDQVNAEQEALEKAFRQTAVERVAFEHQLLALQEEHGGLARAHDELVAERNRLEQALTKAQKRSEEARLRDALAKEQRERKQLAGQLQDAKQLANHLNADHAKAQKEVAKLQSRLGSLQEKHATSLSDLQMLQHKMARMPSDVTKLAREHERLVADLADTHYNLGVLFGSKRDYVRSAAEFRKVIEIRPDDADAHYNLGVIYAEHLPDREKALTFFRRFLSVNPNNQDASFAKQYIATWQAWEGKERLE